MLQDLTHELDEEGGDDSCYAKAVVDQCEKDLECPKTSPKDKIAGLLDSLSKISAFQSVKEFLQRVETFFKELFEKAQQRWSHSFWKTKETGDHLGEDPNPSEYPLFAINIV